MGLFDEKATLTAGQDPGDASAEGIAKLLVDSNLFEKAVEEGVISPTRVVPELRSIIADPELTDPSLDVSSLRTTTPTRQELLADVPEFSGLQFDPTQQSYIEDLYALYGGALPTIEPPVVTTPTTDTTPTVGTGGEGQATGDSGLDSAPIGDLTQSGTFANQPTFTTTPGTTVDNVTGDITNPDGSYGGNIVDEFDPTTRLDTSIAVEDLTQPSNIGDFQITTAPPLGDLTGSISGAPQIASQLATQGPTTIQGPLSQVGVPGVTPEDIQQAKIDEVRLGSYKPSFETVQQENTIQSIIGKAGQTVDNALNELGKIPGAVVDFVNETVDVFGKTLNVGKTLASAAINTVVGGPVSLVFDAISNVEPSVSQIEYDSYTEDQQNAIDKAYGPGGVMEGYNAVSAFGRGPKATVESRLEERTSKGIFDNTTDQLNNLSNKLGGITISAPLYDFDDTTTTTGTPSGNTVDVETGNITDPTGVNVGNIFDEVALTGGGPTSDDDPAGPPEGPGITADDAFGDDGPSDVGGPPSGPGATADEGFGGDGPSDAGGPPSGPGESSADAGFESDGPSGGGGSGGGGGKIVCTMMNESYGFGSFRNKIWLRHSKNLAPEYQIGYHKIFLPLVKISKTNKIIKKILEHIAVHRTIDIRQESRGKVHILGRVYRKILEPICYWVGKYAKR
tara:strand:- start:124 stop:2160 length:2037 start_codon:yes stop_codon:yes gene_type:complete